MSETATTEVLEFPVGDYGARLDKLWNAAQQAEADGAPTTLLEQDPAEKLWEEYEALREESREASRAARTYIVLREVSRKDWRKIKADHPPRTEGDPDAVKADRIAGMNTETAEDELVFAALVEPEFASRAAFDEWADNLGAGKFAAIAEKAYLLTVGARHDPKSRPVSPTRNTPTS